MPHHAAKLRHCISHFEQLLREETDPEVARVYQAELATDRAWLADIERRHSQPVACCVSA